MTITDRESTSWRSVVTAPAPGQHIAQLYTEPGFLVRGVAQFVAEGLRPDDGVVVIAIPLHWQAIARRLQQESFDVDALCRRGQLTVRDAAECLTAVLVDGIPERDRFVATIGGAIASIKSAGYRHVRAFGEMVDLLRRTSLAATVRLEQLRAELLCSHGISLLCGYSLDVLDARIYGGVLQQVSALHSDLVPVEDYARLERAVASAYDDVFGATGDAGQLRRAFAEHYTMPAAMPEAEVAILALSEFVPTASETFLSRVRHHYRSGTPTARTAAG